ncbi:MAG: folylpolyglutamate synthase/dihydrofolate synthase family protein [Alphaproteobacteria bacterium]
MLDKKTMNMPGAAVSQDWTFSSVAAVERAIQDVRTKAPPMLPAGLDRPLRFMEKLGSPHLSLPPVFHVAGTNGKGSTLAFLQAVFESGGLSVHKFTSPHLVKFEERVVVAGREIGADMLLDLIDECTRAAADETVSFFEFFTGLAFLAYARVPADVLLLETGLGGTYDATNIIDKSVALLTRISFDHMRLLGDTLPEIAANKAGIIKRNCPVIIAPQSDDVMDVFLARAREMHAPVSLYGRDWKTVMTGDAFEYQGSSVQARLPLPRLIGSHQIINAGTALAGLEHSAFKDLLKQDILARAMNTVTWPGRMQRLDHGHLADLLPQGWELWIDGAHNDSGADVIVEQAKAWGADKPLHIITGFKRKKDTEGFYERLAGIPRTIQAVNANIDAPMVSPQELCDELKNLGFSGVSPAENLESALQSLVFQFKEPQRILITGSLYLVGLALKLNI